MEKDGYLLLDVPGDFTEFGVVVTVFIERELLPFLEKFGTHAPDDCVEFGVVRNGVGRNVNPDLLW